MDRRSVIKFSLRVANVRFDCATVGVVRSKWAVDSRSVRAPKRTGPLATGVGQLARVDRAKPTFLLNVVVVAADGPEGAGGGDEAHRAGGAVDGGAVVLAELGDGEDGDVLLLGEPDERREHAADDGVEVGIAGADEGVHGIDDDQPAVADAVDGRSRSGEVGAEIGDRRDLEDAVRIGPGGIEAGADGVGEGVGGGEDEHGAGVFEGGRGRVEGGRLESLGFPSAFPPPPSPLASSGQGAPMVTRAATSSARSDLPRPGSPARRVTLPKAMRPGQSQWTGRRGVVAGTVHD